MKFSTKKATWLHNWNETDICSKEIPIEMDTHTHEQYAKNSDRETGKFQESGTRLCSCNTNIKHKLMLKFTELYF